MPTIVLRPDSGVILNGTAASFSVVGAAPQWADDDDASYSTYTSGATVAFMSATLPTLVLPDGATATAVRAWIRVQCNAACTLSLGTTSRPNAGNYIVDLSDDPARFWFEPVAAVLQTIDLAAHDGSGAGHDLGYVVDKLTTGGVWVGARTLSVGFAMKVTDLAVLVDYDTAPEPPTDEHPVTRQYPRDDAYGSMGSAPRIFPPPRSTRIVGGHQ